MHWLGASGISRILEEKYVRGDFGGIMSISWDLGLSYVIIVFQQGVLEA